MRIRAIPVETGHGTGVQITVEDRGMGIDPEELPHIFEPFYRGQRSQGEGTGLGLSIVERIAAAASASVAIENVPPPHTGLRVTVTFADVALSETAYRRASETASA